MSVAPSLDRSPPAEDARLRALDHHVGLLGSVPEERFDRITRVARRLFGVQSALITLSSHNRLWHKSAQGVEIGGAQHHDTFFNTTLRRTEPLIVEDTTADARFADNPYVLGEPHVRFFAGHAIETVDGDRVGAISLVDSRERDFSLRERAQLARLADWVQCEVQSTVETDRAAEVQRGLQPHASALVVPGYELAGICLASTIVGGDLLDWYRTPDGDVVATLGDVMGKGMGAAIMMATVRGAMRAAGRIYAPSEAVEHAAATLDEDLRETGTHVTMCHMRLRPSSGDFAFADVGHGLCLLVRADGTPMRPPIGGLPLGIRPGERWTEFSSVLRPGDALVSFSDGLLELYDGGVRTAFTEVIAVTRQAGSAAEIVDHFAALGRRNHLADDIAVLALRRSA